jgi:hypothetical protein
MADKNEIEEDPARAPRSRVWRALHRCREFGAWFRVKTDGALVERRHARQDHLSRLRAPDHGDGGAHHLSTIFLPVASLRGRSAVDYSSEPDTGRVSIDEAGGGTLLTIVESG